MKRPKPKRKLKHSPQELLQIALVLIMASTVLIIPTADKVTFFQEKYYEYKRYAENTTDENTRAFWEVQEKRHRIRMDESILSLLLTSICAIISLVGVFLYLHSKNAYYLGISSLGSWALIFAVLLLVIAIFS